MTKYESLKTSFDKEADKIKSECETARQKLKEMGFLRSEGFVANDLFQKVFSKYWEYSIHKFELMNVNEKSYALQFMVQFEDNKTEFIYLETK